MLFYHLDVGVISVLRQLCIPILFLFRDYKKNPADYIWSLNNNITDTTIFCIFLTFLSSTKFENLRMFLSFCFWGLNPGAFYLWARFLLFILKQGLTELPEGLTR